VSAEHILARRDGGVATLELNRPDKRNALTAAMLDRMLDQLERLEADSELRVLIIQGAGDAFCAGVDLREMLADRNAGGVVDHSRLESVFRALDGFSCPTIAAVQGVALAGGCELALHCDIRVVSPAARFGMPLARLGIVVPFVLAQRLTDTIGLAAAKDLLFTAEPIAGERAYQLGFATRLAAAADLRAETERIARQIAANAPLSVREMKRVLHRTVASTRPLNDEELEAARLAVSRSQDVQEGLQAFLERRLPAFRGV
jgi:enoyl-CoA hydratase/carnithine racemase